MLYSVKQLIGHELVALQGDDSSIGVVREVYFDDRLWVIRHLVVETGGWFSGRRVLVSPHAVKTIDADRLQLQVALSRQQVQDAPGLDTDRPVSRQHETAAYDFYGYPPYWGGSGLWGMMDLPLGGAIAPFAMSAPDGGAQAAAAAAQARSDTDQGTGDPHLRSSAEVVGYQVAALDGDIGHLDDFLFDPESWQVTVVVVDTRDWLPDRLVLVPTRWVAKVDADTRRTEFKVSREQVQMSPPYESDKRLARDDAAGVMRHFERS